MLSIVKKIMLNNDLCVLCTCHDHMPDASLMLYICDERCNKIHMLTLTASVKYLNIVHNGNVSLLIDTREKMSDEGARINALTIRGAASIVEDKITARRIMDQLIKKHEDLLSLASNDNVCVIEISVHDVLFLEDVDKGYFVSLDNE
jgi:general stress protein 26